MSRLPIPAEAKGAGLTPDHWRVLTEAVFPSAKSAESVMLAVAYCKARGLDVFKRPVHIVPMWNKALRREVETVWPGINEIQVTAARTGQWAGMDAPKWGPDRTERFEGDRTSVTVTFPEWCEVTVYRMVHGVRCPFTEMVYWLEAYGKSGRTEMPNPMWQQRPRGQAFKCAKAAVLRSAFPEEGEYTAEEMAGKEIDTGVTVVEGEADRPRPPRDVTPVAPSVPASAALPVEIEAALASGPAEGAADGEPEGEVLWLYDVDGTAYSYDNDLRGWGALYRDLKAKRTDKVALALANIDTLRRIFAHAKEGGELWTSLKEQIEAAETLLAVTEELAAAAEAADGIHAEAEEVDGEPVEDPAEAA